MKPNVSGMTPNEKIDEILKRLEYQDTLLVDILDKLRAIHDAVEFSATLLCEK